MRSYLWPGAVVLSILMLPGCATRRANAPGLAQPRSTFAGATVESSDKGLSEALLAAAFRPTPGNGLRVAKEYQRLGIIDAAQSRVDRVLEQAPHSAEAHEMMARLWRDSGVPWFALGYAHRAVYFSAPSSSAYNTLGTVLDALGRPDDARQAYLKAFALDRSAAWALNNLCSLELRQGSLEDARTYCEAAVGVSPTLASAHTNLGFVHAAAGDFTKAKAAFLAGGDEAAAHYNIGIAHLAKGHFEAASSAFEEAIRARPDFTAAKSRARYARAQALNKR